MAKMTFKDATHLNTATASTEELRSAQDALQRKSMRDQTAVFLGGLGFMACLMMASTAGPLAVPAIVALCVSGAGGLYLINKKEKPVTILRTQIDNALSQSLASESTITHKKDDAAIHQGFGTKLRNLFAASNNNKAAAATAAAILSVTKATDPTQKP